MHSVALGLYLQFVDFPEVEDEIAPHVGAILTNVTHIRLLMLKQNIICTITYRGDYYIMGETITLW